MKAFHTQDVVGESTCSSCGKKGHTWEYWKSDELGTHPVEVLAVFCNAHCSSAYHSKLKEEADG